jgi:hypothetical protein
LFLDGGPYAPRVSDRGNPERVYQIERAQLFNRLVDEQRVNLLDAERWLRRWEAKAEEIGRPRASLGFWDEGRRWIYGELSAKRRKPD